VTNVCGKSPIAAVVRALREAGLDCDPRDVADACWLWGVMTPDWAHQAPAPLRVGSFPDDLSLHHPAPQRPAAEATKPPVNHSPSVPPNGASTAATVTVSVYLGPKETTRAGLPVEIPAPSAVPEHSVVMKALRPLLERAPSHSRQAFDAEATARRRADERILEPVLAWIPTGGQSP
jgi:hypothetical protein